MKKLAALTLSMFLVYGTALADTPKEADAQPAKAGPAAKPKPAKKADKTDAAIAAQLEELRQALQSQQEQLQMLKEELAKRDRQIDEAREAAAAANARAAEASTKATEAVNSTAEVKSTTATLNSTVSDLKASNEVLKTTVATEQADAQKSMDEGPTTIRYKGISITPGGYLAGETVYRTHATGADIATPFTAIPFQASDLAHESENAFTGRQSRLSMLAQGKLGAATLTGYVEADFLGAGTTSNNRQTNSYVFRQRQLFAQASFDNGWIITGGQQWTLAAENRKGILNRQEDTPNMIDPNYVIGWTWARQYGMRFVKDFGGKFALGFSVEGPQATIGGRGFSTVTTVNDTAAATTILTSGATTATTGNFFLNAPGSGPGLYNAFDSTGYTVNKAPDLIFKAAADPGFGHYEIFGIVSFFRDRIYPCGVVGTNAKDTVPVPIVTPTTLTCTVGGVTSTTVSSLGATNTSSNGGGGGVSALWSVFNKKVDFGAKAVAGDGIGRYGDAQLADATARPDGTLSLIRTAHGLGRLEWHPTPKLDVYAYYGAEYAWRAGYQGYNSITITKTPVIPSNGTSPAIPATTTTNFTFNSIGGYGNQKANNTGCATEGVPTNDFNPSAGANCAGDIRLIQEGTLGFWYKFYQGSHGRLQFGMQYSYLAKVAWSGVGGVTGIGGAAPIAISPKANDNMVFTSFRYYLP
jgi:hypothetical protein